ncbi:hypothetical protein Pla22_24520 [Rubripirellula amarantea]|uniref:Uncharacterized protein n=1 Tax=Rubripirellula amarantea TaxID=2527999 RepID=A0A5C5WW50_9BACT|nr:hypothetical protein Pla22_24520 [Rubripirellula amarantea]
MNHNALVREIRRHKPIGLSDTRQRGGTILAANTKYTRRIPLRFVK